jgi:hypothetical protein
LNNGILFEKEAESPVTLRHYLAQRKLKINEFLRLALQLAITVSRFHKKGRILEGICADMFLLNTIDGSLVISNNSSLNQALFYLAPEQTGRLNRPVDLRANIFSLGALYYEMLTGKLPTTSKTKLEWFSKLMAGNIKPTHQMEGEIPKVVSEIVMKCLDKNPDKRYQSIYALKKDLKRCLEQWQENGRIKSFKIGEYDPPLLFKGSTKFFGRKEELQLLQAAVERVSCGSHEIIFIKGSAGVGKTSLLKQFAKQFKKNKQGFFISGRYEVSIIKLKDYKTGIPLGKAALTLAEQSRSAAEKYIVYFLYGAFFLPWVEHTRQGEPYLKEAMKNCLEAQDFTYAGYAITFSLISQHFRGIPLPELEAKIRSYLKLAPKVSDPYFSCFLTIYRQMTLNLLGLTMGPDSFSDHSFDEEGFINGETGYKIREKELFDYYLCKNQVCYLMGKYDIALPFLKKAEKLTKLYFGEVYLADHAFYYCLTLTAKYRSVSIAKRAAFWWQLLKKYRQLKHWAKHCPDNYKHKQLLIEAELARIRGKNDKAALLYDQAVRSAKKYQYKQNAAIANECAARFYFSRGLDDLAAKCLYDAYEGYRAWGAETKTDQLCSQYPWLAEKVGLHRQALVQSLKHWWTLQTTNCQT